MYVYVIIWGCIGDESVQGVYSTKAKANKALKNLKGDFGEAWIQKWKVDDDEYHGTGKQYQ